MKKVAIVGVEGSGKTVMLAGLGDLYTYPDDDGYFLAPKNFGTAEYVTEKIKRMREGEWPVATAGDEMQGLDWALRRRKPDLRDRPESICEVSFLDFAGEVYRTAFGIGAGDQSLAEQARELKQYVKDADDLIVLINLRDVIMHGIRDRRVQEAMWITNAILETALSEQAWRKQPRAAIVLSQADSYADTIRVCGGAAGVLQKYLPHVANNYGWLDVFAASAVDKTKLDGDGNVVPAPDFQPTPLSAIMDWIKEGIAQGETLRIPVPRQPVQQGKQIKENVSSKPKPVVQKKVNVFVFALTLIAALGSAIACLVNGHWGIALFLGSLLLPLACARGSKRVKQDARSWLATIPIWVLTGALGASDEFFWGAVIFGIAAYVEICQDPEEKK